MEYIISESRLLELLEEEAKLIALENGGVDNWEWYGMSNMDYLNLCERDTFFDIACDRLNDFVRS